MNMEMGKFKPGLANETRKERVQKALDAIGEHRVINKLHPELLGEGGMHAVFSVDGLPKDVVAKVRRTTINEALYLVKKGRDLKNFRTFLQSELRRERASAKLARQYFGNYILRERIGIMDVPITNDLLQEISRPDQTPPEVSPGIYEVPALVTLQDRAPEAAFGEGSESMQLYYLEYAIENFKEAEQFYNDINRRYLDGESGGDPDFGVRVLSVNEKGVSESLELLDCIKQDERLRDKMIDFIVKAMKFSRETGNIVDNAWAQALGMKDQLKLINEPIAPHSGQILAYFEMLRESEDGQVSKVSSQHAAAK